MDRELLYNQSGVKDITAYKAITNLQSGGDNNMECNGYEINKGEIWEVENGYVPCKATPGSVSTKLVVVLNCYEKYAATVMLQEQEPTSNAVPVRARSVMYADAGRLGYMYYDKMVDFVRKLSEDEDRELRQAIGEALEIPVDEAPLESMATDANREIDGLQYEIAQLRQLLKAKTEEAEAARQEVQDMIAQLSTADEIIESQSEELEEAQAQARIALMDVREELAAASREAEIYKGLYENMLARALG